MAQKFNPVSGQNRNGQVNRGQGRQGQNGHNDQGRSDEHDPDRGQYDQGQPGARDSDRGQGGNGSNGSNGQDERTPRQRPEFETYAWNGRIKGTVWRNVGEHGPWFGATITRVYQDGDGLMKQAHSFSCDELLFVSEVARELYGYIRMQS